MVLVHLSFLRRGVQRVEEEREQHQVVVEVLHERRVVGVLVVALEGLRNGAAEHVFLLDAQITHEVGGQILDLHGVRHVEIRVDAVAAVGRVLLFQDELLALVVFLGQLDEVHLLEYLEVNVDEALGEQRAVQQVYQVVLLQVPLEQVKDLAQLERESLLVVRRVFEPEVGTSEFAPIIVETFLHVVVFAVFKSQYSPLDICGERDKLLGEHVVKELLQRLVLFLARLFSANIVLVTR